MKRSAAILALVATLSLVAISCSATAPAAKPLLEVGRVVRYEHRLVNASDKPATMELFIAVPKSNERQKILSFVPDPSCSEELIDEYGTPILHFVDRDVPPGEVIAHGWIAEVEVANLVHDRSAATVKELPPAMREPFLRDGQSYQITAPAVAGLAGELAADSASDEETVRAIFEYLARNLTYERDDVWDPAPVVLERKTGSCSEYNYAFLALCRAAGIPARYTGGVVLRSGRAAKYDSSVTEDAVFHRWSEVFLSGSGWFPVDCSRASGEMKRFGNPENYYGRLPAGLLQCVRGDGLGDTPLGWDYLSNQKVPFDAKDWSGKVAFWIDGVEKGTLKATVAAVRGRLEGAQDRALFDTLLKSTIEREILFFLRNLIRPDALPDLVAALAAAKHPEAVYFSILAAQRGAKLAPELRYGALCGSDTARRIEKHYVEEDGTRDLFTFEYWWRKARPLMRWESARGVFALPAGEINIY